MATAIGSVIAFTAKRTNYRFLSVATGFSAGVMLYVSFVEIYVKGSDALTGRFGEPWGHWFTAASFFGGMLLIALIDNLIPAAENPHETHSEAETRPLHDPNAPLPDFEALATAAVAGSATSKGGGAGAALTSGDAACAYGVHNHGVHNHGVHHRKLMRMGLFTAVAISIHNFPEGLATFLAALQDPTLGLAIAIAVALHNIPEGISVSVPIFYATGDRKKAFLYSTLSGMAEPVGAIVGYLALRFFFGGDAGAIPEHIMGVLFAGVAGIMVYISLDELLPTSRAYGKGHDSMLGLVAGMLVMALSLLLMK